MGGNGRHWHGLERSEELRAQYSEAYKLDPESTEALLSLGSLDSLDGHYKDAAGRHETVLKLDSKILLLPRYSIKI